MAVILFYFCKLLDFSLKLIIGKREVLNARHEFVYNPKRANCVQRHRRLLLQSAGESRAENSDADMDPPSKSWSIHTRAEIIAKYEVLERVGSGAYSDVYRGRRLSDDLIVALKEVHDYQSAFREIEALQILQNSPHVVVLHEYFWREDEDAVLVLEFLRTDLATVIREAKKEAGGFGVGEIKRWMIQILCGVDACHRNMIVHRDLKPGNLLISDDGVLKLADFGQVMLSSFGQLLFLWVRN